MVLLRIGRANFRQCKGKVKVKRKGNGKSLQKKCFCAKQGGGVGDKQKIKL